MKKRLFVVFLAAALMFIWGGMVSAQGNPDHAAILAEAEKIAQNMPGIIAAEEAAYKAGAAAERYRQQAAPSPGLPPVSPARQQSVAKPPVVAAPVEKPKKAAEQAKVQVPPAKPQQPPQPSAPPPIQAAKPVRSAPNAQGNTLYAMQLPPLEADVPYNGIIYKKNEVLYMVGWITPDGRTVDETGNPIKDTILTRVRPQGAIIEVYQKPSNRQ